jgi:NADPH-dependent curcumin reductase CurA
VKGAEVFVALSGIKKKEFIMKIFGIPEDSVFSSRDLSFSRGTKRISPRGVDIVLNSLSVKVLRKSWACVAP